MRERRPRSRCWVLSRFFTGWRRRPPMLFKIMRWGRGWSMAWARCGRPVGWLRWCLACWA